MFECQACKYTTKSQKIFEKHNLSDKHKKTVKPAQPVVAPSTAPPKPLQNNFLCKLATINSRATCQLLQALDLDDDDLFAVPCIYCAKKHTSRKALNEHVLSCSHKPIGSSQISDDSAADTVAHQNGFANHIHQDLNIDIEDQNKIFQLIVKEQHKKIIEMSRLMRFINQILNKYLEKEQNPDEE